MSKEPEATDEELTEESTNSRFKVRVWFKNHTDILEFTCSYISYHKGLGRLQWFNSEPQVLKLELDSVLAITVEEQAGEQNNDPQENAKEEAQPQGQPQAVTE